MATIHTIQIVESVSGLLKMKDRKGKILSLMLSWREYSPLLTPVDVSQSERDLCCTGLMCYLKPITYMTSADSAVNEHDC